VQTGSIVVELNSTWTAQWYQTASGTQRADAWAERLRYFAALSELLRELVKGDRPPQPAAARQLLQIAPRGLVSEVARRAHFAAHETLYKRFRPDWEGPIARWAGNDDTVKPRSALVAEAKIVSFWPYRDGVVRLADKPDVLLQDVAEAYLLALAEWASDDIPLAACRPAGPPACMAEDMAAIAALWLRRARSGRMTGVPRPGAHSESRDRERDLLAGKAGQLERLAGSVVRRLLEKPELPAAKAVEGVHDDLGRLLADPADPVADQLARAAAQLSERLARPLADDPPVTPQQARRLLATLAPLTARLSAIAELAGPSGICGLRPVRQPRR
jgi:hypothetical protein